LIIVIQTSTHSIEEIILSFDFLHPSAGHFHQRKEDGLVVHNLIKLAGFVLQVSRVQPQKQFVTVRTQVTELHFDVPVQIIAFLCLSVLLGEPFTHLKGLSVEVKIGVENPCPFGLIAPVEHLEGVSADELVVRIDGDHVVVPPAVLGARHVNVFDGSHSD